MHYPKTLGKVYSGSLNLVVLWEIEKALPSQGGGSTRTLPRQVRVTLVAKWQQTHRLQSKSTPYPHKKTLEMLGEARSFCIV